MMPDYSLLLNLLGLAACAAGFVAIFQASREQRQRNQAERDVQFFIGTTGRISAHPWPAPPERAARPLDPRTTLKPRIVTRADGFAYVVLERPTPQKGLTK